MGRGIYGECRICGTYSRLTYEHVPPRCAFNDEPIKSYKLGEWWKLQAGESARHTNEQRGAGDHLLCDRCNNHVCGTWYVPELCKWVRAVAPVWEAVPDGADETFVANIGLRRVRPALFAKQVVAMLLASTPPGFANEHPELQRVVLKRDARGLPERYQLYLILFKRDVARETGVYSAFNAFGARAFQAVELSYPPFSYLLTIGEGSVAERLGAIGRFLDDGPDDERELKLQLAVNWTLLPEDIATPT